LLVRIPTSAARNCLCERQRVHARRKGKHNRARRVVRIRDGNCDLCWCGHGSILSLQPSKAGFRLGAQPLNRKLFWIRWHAKVAWFRFFIRGAHCARIRLPGRTPLRGHSRRWCGQARRWKLRCVQFVQASKTELFAPLHERFSLHVRPPSPVQSIPRPL
jgi:hypothetical protein